MVAAGDAGRHRDSERGDAHDRRARPDVRLGGIESPSALYMLNLPVGWVVQSIKYKGREIVDAAATFTDEDDAAALRFS